MSINYEYQPSEFLSQFFAPFSYRVIWALKLKGINYEYVAEDLSKKSEQLSRYNPVNKKIPVLVHNGKPISESTVILEYIEETWPESYPLLPKDPYEKSLARFWIKFMEEKGTLSIGTFWKTTGEEQDKAIKEILEIMKIIEEQSGIGDAKMFFGGDCINAVDLAFAPMAHWFGAMEEVAGVKLLQAHEFPKFHAWTERFKQVPVIKDNLPNFTQLLGIFKGIREHGYLVTPPK